MTCWKACTETDSEEGRFASVKTYACGDSEAVKEAYHEALLESGFIELQQYPEGFAVYKIGGSFRIYRG